MSDYFITPKGTKLPFLNLKGKDYLQVAHRLVWFREEHPDWGIRTSFHTVNDQYVIAKAEIINQTVVDEDGGSPVIATAHKREDKSHFPDHIEKAETGAIGRALALCGYGTQFAPELDEEDRIVDTPVGRAKPAPKTVEPKTVEKKKEEPFDFSAAEEEAKNQKAGNGMRDKYNRELMALYRPYLSKFPQTQFGKLLAEKYGVEETRLMTVEQLADLAKYMEKAIGMADDLNRK